MKSIEVLRTRDLPFSLMTTTHGLMVVADGEENNLFTYCPVRGVMLGLGGFDDRPRMYTPKCLQLFDAPVGDLIRMKQEWEAAAYVRDGKSHFPVPFIPKLQNPVMQNTQSIELAAFEALCDAIEDEIESSQT